VAVGWYALHGSTAAIFREGNMKQETTWLVLGQEWRDLSLIMFGMGVGTFLTLMVKMELNDRKKRKQK
jgi:hypothetical protein